MIFKEQRGANCCIYKMPKIYKIYRLLPETDLKNCEEIVKDNTVFESMINGEFASGGKMIMPLT